MLITALVLIVVLAYIVESLLDNLNQSRARNTLDPKIAGLYDAQERERSISYSAEKNRFGFYSATFSTVVMVLALSYGWFATIDNWVRERIENQIVISLAFIALLSVISWWLNLPFQLYSIFGIEAKYGFNKITPKTFITDAIKGSILATIIGGTLLTAVLWLYQKLDLRLGSGLWIFAADVYVWDHINPPAFQQVKTDRGWRAQKRDREVLRLTRLFSGTPLCYGWF
jgi:STE24 endopeptidase